MKKYLHIDVKIFEYLIMYYSYNITDPEKKVILLNIHE